jgi:hypothetical protein
MSGLQDREKAFEQKFKMDQDLQFKVNSRAVKALGLWAAEKLGMSGDDADCYADTVVDADFDEPGFEDVYRKVMADFDAKGVNIEKSEIVETLDQKLAIVKQELSQELGA